MNYLDGKCLILLFGLVQSALSFSKDVTISIGVSIISTLTVCVILSIIAWNCCLRSPGAKKHQFDVENEVNKGFVLANYDNTVSNTNTTQNGNTTLQCPKCGHTISRILSSTLSDHDRKHFNSTNNRNSCKGTSVDVVVHNNSRYNPQDNNSIVQMMSYREESSIAPATEERSTFTVKLKKTDSGSLGLSIVGGRRSRLGDIGVFIKSTIANTPASSNGQLKPWDQILKVNEVELDGKTLEEALKVLKEQSSEITLTILPSEQATANLEASLNLKTNHGLVKFEDESNRLRRGRRSRSLEHKEITSAAFPHDQANNNITSAAMTREAASSYSLTCYSSKGDVETDNAPRELTDVIVMSSRDPDADDDEQMIPSPGSDDVDQDQVSDDVFISNSTHQLDYHIQLHEVELDECMDGVNQNGDVLGSEPEMARSRDDNQGSVSKEELLDVPLNVHAE